MSGQFTGYKMTCFTDEEEAAVGLASRATWLLETELKDKIGIDFSRGKIWEPYMVEDRNLVTGQNPASAAILGKRLLEVLGSQRSSDRDRSRKPKEAEQTLRH